MKRLLLLIAALLLPVQSYAQLIGSDRLTTWQPGVTYNGGIPARATQCGSALNPSGGDDTSAINSALSGCTTGQHVKLNAGTFLVNGVSAVQLQSNVTLRGSGAGVTILQRTANGNAIFDTNLNGTDILAASGGGSITAYTSLSADAAKGATTVTVSGSSVATLFASYTTIKYVLIDHRTNATNVSDPRTFAHGDGVFSNNTGNVWRSPDSEIFWPDRDASGALPWYVGVYFRTNVATDGDDARPQGEIKEISSMSNLGGGSYSITFTSPLHHAFTTTRLAQVAWWSGTWKENIGVEDLTLDQGGNGNIRLHQCAKCWLARIESKHYIGPSIFMSAGYRNEVRDSYIHDAYYPYSGGGGYAQAYDYYTSELLMENNIIVRTAKPMVFRSSGAGSVVSYNYVDAQFDGSSTASWMEVGINGSHMVGGYMILFEANWTQNFDADKRWGPSDYMMVLRNYLRGRNELSWTWAGNTYTEASSNGPQRAGGAQAWSYWLSFVGNVMGKSGTHSGWLYETGTGIFESGIWSLGWDDVSPYGRIGGTGNGNDPEVTNTAQRDGNYDYLTSQVHWHGVGGSGSSNGLTPPGDPTIPNTLYLSGKPSWFGNCTWPWVDATGSTKTYTLPAKARFDASQPNNVSYSACAAVTGTGNGTGGAMRIKRFE